MNARRGLAAADANGAMDTPSQADRDQAVSGNDVENPGKLNAPVVEFIG